MVYVKHLDALARLDQVLLNMLSLMQISMRLQRAGKIRSDHPAWDAHN